MFKQLRRKEYKKVKKNRNRNELSLGGIEDLDSSEMTEKDGLQNDTV